MGLSRVWARLADDQDSLHVVLPVLGEGAEEEVPSGLEVHDRGRGLAGLDRLRSAEVLVARPEAAVSSCLYSHVVAHGSCIVELHLDAAGGRGYV